MEFSIKYIGIIISVFFLAFIIWLFGYPYPYYLNNMYKNTFTKQLETLDLPPNTQRLGIPYSAYGNLFGQSNKGVYFACILIQSKLKEAEIQKFFRQKRLLSAENANKSIEIRVQKVLGLGVPSVNNFEEMTSGELVILSPCWFGLTSKNKLLFKAKQNFYTVFIIDGPYNSDDFRCH